MREKLGKYIYPENFNNSKLSKYIYFINFYNYSIILMV